MRFDETTCSLHYSNEDQLRFCEIRDPAIWPAVLDAPSKEHRPGRWSPNVVVFTSAKDSEVQEQLSKRLFPEPDMSELTNSMNVDAVQNGEVLSSAGVILGTPEKPRSWNYIEEAFRGTGPLILSSNCARDYPGADVELLNEVIYNISVHAIPPTPPNNSRPEHCTNIQSLHDTSAEIDRYLYCNFDEVRLSFCCLVLHPNHDLRHVVMQPLRYWAYLTNSQIQQITVLTNTLKPWILERPLKID